MRSFSILISILIYKCINSWAKKSCSSSSAAGLSALYAASTSERMESLTAADFIGLLKDLFTLHST